MAKAACSRGLLRIASGSSSGLPFSHLLLLRSYATDDAHRKKGSIASPSSPHFSSGRDHHDESRAVKVSVWWDFQNCSIPDGVDAFRVAQRITSALRLNGIKGSISITAHGDVTVLTRANQESLSATGISFKHIPNNGKNSADRSLLLDLVYWVFQNPPPAHLFLISGDRDFANILHRLRMSNYNILLASTDAASGVLCSAASIMWHWNELVRGDILTGKHFNHPPDGPHASWYGHYRGPLEDPFANLEPEESSDLSMEPNIRPIPKALVNRIRQILDAYPEGLSLCDLRLELRRNNVAMDSDFFGYKKFSRFLLAFPTILKLERSPDDSILLVRRIHSNPIVYGAHSQYEVDSSLKPYQDVNISNKQYELYSLQEGGKPLSSEDTKAAQPVEPYPKLLMKGESIDLLQDQPECIETNKPSHLASEQKGLEGQALGQGAVGTPVHGKDTTFERVKKFLFGPGNGCYSENIHRVQENTEIEKSDQLRGSHSTKSKTESYLDKTMILHSSLTERLVRWFMFGKTEDANADQVTGDRNKDELEKLEKDTDTFNLGLENPLLFSNNHFWDELESFLQTAKAFALVSRSRTRAQLELELQREGPHILKTLDPQNLSHLVDVIISEKKWVQEHLSLYYPFKVTMPIKSLSSSSNAKGSNGLSSIFSKRSSNASVGENVMPKQPHNLVELKLWLKKFQNSTIIEVEDFKRLFQQEFNKNLDSSFYGFPSVETLFYACILGEGKKKSDYRSKQQILSDCQTLLEDILESYPQGFNMSSFKRVFHGRYNYRLHYQKLGFPKLVSLLQSMPGVIVENNTIYPAVDIPKEHNTEVLASVQGNRSMTSSNLYAVAGSSSKGIILDQPVDTESSWQEVHSATDIGHPEAHAHSEDEGIQDEDELVEYNEESMFSEEKVSDLEVDVPILENSGKKNNACQKGGSLLEILDSMQSGENGKENENKSHYESLDGLVDCSSSNLKPTTSCSVETENYVNPISHRQKVKPGKNYSFVLNSSSDDKEKLIESILGSLKKAGDSKVQT
ncbi:hypothetical protein H6P81_015619 [Aristolochia fimbriata]|uniref:HTH OST-type domain-containing protein n=1 Tax=Aristolochia fimbriata TaxID=158543 RepID=A0AAV7E7W1_ARIFI|nr:hypothetical protein H6P81_015619 [Aristolochia fimbriata]